MLCACIFWTLLSCLDLSRQSYTSLTAEESSQQRLLSNVAMLVLILCYAPQVLCVFPRPNHKGKPG